jgi:hypothetical protein
MKTPDMNDIRRELRTRYAAPPPPTAGEFWAQADARLDREQREAMRRAHLTRAQFRMVWSAAVAAAGFAAVLGIVWLNSTPAAPEQVADAGSTSALLALDVPGGCQSVMALEGRKNKGTVILVTGLPAD